MYGDAKLKNGFTVRQLYAFVKTMCIALDAFFFRTPDLISLFGTKTGYTRSQYSFNLETLIYIRT